MTAVSANVDTRLLLSFELNQKLLYSLNTTALGVKIVVVGNAMRDPSSNSGLGYWRSKC